MMNVDEYKLPLKKVIEEFELEKIYETDDLDSVMITNTDVNRPGLQMVGFFDYFDNSRIQIMGKVEFTYLEQFHADERAEKIEKLMSQHIPALIVTRGLQIFPEMIELAEKYNVPLLRSESGTSAFMSALIFATPNMCVTFCRHTRFSTAGVIIIKRCVYRNIFQ